MNQTDARQYARVLLHAVNLQVGQNLMVRCEPGHWDFALLLAGEAYSRGARYVRVEANHADLFKARIEASSEEYLDYVPAYRPTVYSQIVDEGWAFISIKSPVDPDALSGLDPRRNGIVQKALAASDFPFLRALQSDKFRWVVAALPSEKWAAKVLSTEPSPEAAERLWEIIKPTIRLDAEDPIAAWDVHLSRIKHRVDWLNDLDIDSVRFRGPGTDFTVGLTPGSIWDGGGSTTPDGHPFIANVPTEEVFTTPDFRRTSGEVTATRPVLVLEKMVEGAWLRFEEGCVVEAKAKVGQEILETFLEMDADARFLGELALVDSSSPIFASGVVFHNILYDDNAASHIALGSSYPTCVRGGQEMTDERYREIGGNISTVHKDFMIGSPEVEVTAETRDGRSVGIIEGGYFAGE